MLERSKRTEETLVSAMVLLALSMGRPGGSTTSAQTPKPFVLADHAIPPGERADLDLPIAAGTSDPSTYIPITVLHGAQPGPVVALTMGVHGYEFAPILAGQALLWRLDPRRLSGTIILVRIAHIEAFERRVPYVNPHDLKNLNRVFPGRADGTQSERIAWALTTEVIRRCDLHVEVHGGDGAEWLEAFVGIYGGKLAAAQYPKSREMGLALGFQNIVKYSMETEEQIDRGRSLNRQAVADGKPTVLIEIGENGRRDAAFVDPIVTGIENLLSVLRMTSGTPVSQRQDSKWFDGTASADATVTGILTPAASRGRMVRKGEVIGTVRDYAGRVREEIRSPVDGYALYGLAGPPVRAGESVATIALPAKGPL
jgi:uncharacterized protein